MPASIREVLARVARELEDEEAAEAFEELKGKKPTWEEVRDAIAAAPPEERAALRALLIEEGAPPEEVKGKGNGKKEPSQVEPPPDPDDAQPGPPKRRTRPGRRSGGAYDWYVDEESGEVVRSPVAVIYTGEDEPDEVEMLDAGDDDGEGGDDE